MPSLPTFSLTIDTDGHIIVAAPLSDARVLVAKFTPEGALEWERAQLAGVTPPGSGDPGGPCPDADGRDSFAPLLIDADPHAPKGWHRERAARRGRRARTIIAGAFLATLAAATVGAEAPWTASAGATELRRVGPPLTTLLGATPDLEDEGRPVTIPAAGDEAISAPRSPIVVPATTDAQSDHGLATDWIEPFAAPSRPGRGTATGPAEPPSPPPPPPSEPVGDTSSSAPDLRLALRETMVAALMGGEATRAELGAQTWIQHHPHDAFGYLCLGAALDQLGRPSEAQRAYRACAEVAQGNGVDTCRAWADRGPAVASED
ncbi:MAG: hypothetical protein AAGN82_19850 [Myxococcota bacterium]